MRNATSAATDVQPSRLTLTTPLSLIFLGSLLTAGALSSGQLFAAEPSDYLPSGRRHALYQGDLPAGVVGQARLQRRGPVVNYYQPVQFVGPTGVKFALAENGSFGNSQDGLMAGLLIGSVYRYRVTEIPGAEGVELYPTVELIDRTYPPANLATLYPIPVVLDESDIEAALDGRMVTRVVYLEDPQTAIAIPGTPTESRVMELSSYQDPLHEADRLGRPVAIVRMGSVRPPAAPALLPQFFFGFPTWAPIFQPEP